MQAAALDLWLAVGDHLLGHGREVDRLAPVEGPLTAGETEERLDQPLELLLGGKHPFVGGAQ